MQRIETEELTVEELTAEAMQLLTLRIEELYVVLGCQLIGTTRPARVAELVSHQTALKSLIKPPDHQISFFSGGDLSDWGTRFNSIQDELQRDGIRFLSAVREDLRKGLANQEFIDFSTEITSSTMQIIVLIVAAVLKLPRQIDGVSATVAAIICKSGVRQFPS